MLALLKFSDGSPALRRLTRWFSEGSPDGSPEGSQMARGRFPRGSLGSRYLLPVSSTSVSSPPGSAVGSLTEAVSTLSSSSFTEPLLQANNVESVKWTFVLT